MSGIRDKKILIRDGKKVGSGMEKSRIRDREKHPGFATLVTIEINRFRT